ncbi:MAG: hypothetical protein EZS28_050073, partial [Streblomastix strix]
ASSLDRYDYF